MSFISGLVWGAGIFSIWFSFFKKRNKVYRYPAQGWLDIEKHPLPEDLKGFISSDGQEIMMENYIDYSPTGRPYFCKYEKTYIKFWQPLPEAPSLKVIK